LAHRPAVRRADVMAAEAVVTVSGRLALVIATTLALAGCARQPAPSPPSFIEYSNNTCPMLREALSEAISPQATAATPSALSDAPV
jgi:hypothetical protein